MKTPPFLMGAALLFWGWRCGFLALALVPAILVELSHFIPLRWEFSLTDLRRIFDLCIVLVLVEAVVILSTADHLSSEMSTRFSQWLPLPLMPMLFAQAFGTLDKIPLSVFSIFLRRKPESPIAKKAFNVFYPYFTICLMAAGSTPAEDRFFYPGIVLLIGYALWSARPRRPRWSSGLIWVLLIVMVTGFAFMGQRGLRIAQGNLEEALSDWVNTYWQRDIDPLRSKTAIGKVGRIRLSGKIVLRITPENGDPLPNLLHEASYNLYTNGIWRMDANSHTRTQDTNDTISLSPAKKVHFGAKISMYLHNGTGVLPLPKGTYELRNIPTYISLNYVGTVRLEAAPSDLINTTIYYGPGGESIYGRPTRSDLDIPPAEVEVLAEIGEELGLDDPNKSETEKIQAIEHYFHDFKYTLTLGGAGIDASKKRTALGQFLTTTKAGHCEYFATATVLLLRQAGIPARYATGYAVNESSHNGKTCLVRERHGHAWVLAYRQSGRWDELDTTPAGWEKTVDEDIPAFEGISDAWANLRFEFDKWRNSKNTVLRHLQWVLIPLIVYFGWRVVFSKRNKQKIDKSGSVKPVESQGLDSEFYRIEERLAKTGLSRMPNELYAQWTRRVALPDAELLNHILELHRRLRFDPQGISPAEREALRLEVERWLASYHSQQAPRETQVK